MSTESPWASPDVPSPDDENDAPDLDQQPPVPTRGPGLGRRVSISCLGPAAVYLVGVLPAIRDTSLYGSAEAPGYQPMVGELGIAPFISSFILVEVVAAIVPALRRLRLGGRAGRRKLLAAALVLGAVSTFVQAFVVAQTWAAIQPALTLIPTAAVFVGGTLLLAVVAIAIDLYGLGSGFAIILTSQIAIAAVDQAKSFSITDGSFRSVAICVVAPLLVAALGVSLAGGRAQKALRPQHAGVAIPFIGCGVGALVVWGDLSVFVINLQNYGLDVPALSDIDERFALLLESALLLVGVFIYLVVYNGPARVARIAARGLGSGDVDADVLARGALGRAFRMAMLFGGATMVANHFSLAVPFGFSVLTFFVVLMLGRDLIDEWNARFARGDLVEIWPIHRPYAVATIIHALKEANIDGFVFGLRYRTLGQFFSPYTPIQIAVREAEAERAQALIARIDRP